jgi:hypothetical protein
LDVDDRYVAAMPNCILRFCYHQFSELLPTTEANLKTYSRQKCMKMFIQIKMQVRKTVQGFEEMTEVELEIEILIL